jgi:signal transduction histidine kinase
VLGQTLDLFLPESARLAHHRHIPAFGETGVTTRSMHALQPLTALRANGEEFPIEATISQVESFGEKLYTVIIRDITERMRSEAERVQLLENERTARAEAEAAVRTRDVFLSIAAHELRTPLTALLGHTHLLERRAARDGSLAERELRGLNSITEQAKRLNRLIEALLDVSRIQLGRFQLQQQPFDLSALVKRVIDELRPSLEQHTFDVEYPPTLMIVGDEMRLEQVLQNLVSNAIKYSPQGGVIRLCVKLQNDTVLIRISDQGIGIPESSLPHLFSQFYRATNVDPKRISGLGIGLYVVKEIVMRHGGEVVVESVEGQGATFTVTLPRTAGTIPA